MLALLVSGCSAPAPSPQATADFAAKAMPSDTRLAALYTQSCKICHADPASGAPLTGDAAAWRPRLAQGDDMLLESVISGKNAMPAGGQCLTCTPADFKALIEFMSKAKPR